MRKKKETLKHYKEQGNPEDQAKEYLDEEEVNNMLSFKYDNPALWRKLSEDKIKDIVKNISYVDIQKLYFTTSKVVYKSQIRLTGYVTTKVGKNAAVFVGGGIILAQVAHNQGYGSLDWTKIQDKAQAMHEKLNQTPFYSSVNDFSIFF
ncbi:hypothetical protein FQA39_LY00775 [Lamprigera yunnana]|nr:hypothetical protein FQA39_LY00775 [Lamprigera yunnana]